MTKPNILEGVIRGEVFRIIAYGDCAVIWLALEGDDKDLDEGIQIHIPKEEFLRIEQNMLYKEVSFRVSMSLPWKEFTFLGIEEL